MRKCLWRGADRAGKYLIYSLTDAATDAAEPRICVKFSEVLKKGRVDYLPFVTVDGQAPKSVSARDALTNL